jgi:hypothetical protein
LPVLPVLMLTALQKLSPSVSYRCAQNKDNLPLYEMRFSYGSPKIVLVFENKAVGSELKQWLPT